MSGTTYVDLPALRALANKDLAPASTELKTRCSTFDDLELIADTSTGAGPIDNSTTVFGALVADGRVLGSKYNAIVWVLSQVGLAYARSVENFATTLTTIADNYQNNDTAIAGG